MRASGIGRVRADGGTVSRSLAWTKPMTASAVVAPGRAAATPRSPRRGVRPRRRSRCGRRPRPDRAARAPSRTSRPPNRGPRPSARGRCPRGSRPPATRRAGGRAPRRCARSPVRHGLDTERPHPDVGEAVEHPDDRTEHGDVGPVRAGEHEQRPLGGGDGDGLGDHLADDHVEEHDDGEGDHEADAVEQALGQLDPSASTPDSMRSARAGSATAPRPRDAIVIPSWRAGELEVEVAATAARARRARRSPASAIGSSAVRRDAISANSTATKNAFASSSSTADAPGGPTGHRCSPRRPAR